LAPGSDPPSHEKTPDLRAANRRRILRRRIKNRLAPCQPSLRHRTTGDERRCKKADEETLEVIIPTSRTIQGKIRIGHQRTFASMAYIRSAGVYLQPHTSLLKIRLHVIRKDRIPCTTSVMIRMNVPGVEVLIMSVRPFI